MKGCNALVSERLAGRRDEGMNQGSDRDVCGAMCREEMPCA